MVKEPEKKIQELQALEQNLQNLLLQRQTFQARLLENENALKELAEAKKETYKVIGNIMVLADKEKLKTQLEQEKEVVELRIKNIENQEANLKEKATKLQQEVLRELKK